VLEEGRPVVVEALRHATWYARFPSDYRWSYNTLITLAMAPTGGAELGEVDQVCRRLADDVGDDDRWFEEWRRQGDRVRALAVAAEEAGHTRSGVAHYRRACGYYFAAERFRFPKDEQALEVYRDMLATFRRAGELDPSVPIEHVEVPYEDTSLPAFFVDARRSADDGPAPAVVFFNGFDGNKELNWFLGIEELFRRGISVLSVDSPGVGEAIRFRGIPLRHDYEAAGSAALDHLLTRPGVDPDRIAIMALSLGGYYATRSASMDARFRACVAWGAIWNYHRIWRERIEAAYDKQLPVPGAHLAWSTRTGSPMEALDAIAGFDLDGVVQKMRCSYLLVHGEDDQQVPVSDAYALFDACGSDDKTLRVFDGDEGGAQHCHMDNLAIARPFIFDWLGDRLGV
jgi:dienelactone hydrolase